MSGKLTTTQNGGGAGGGWQPRVSALETSVGNMEGDIKEIKILLERRQLPISTILSLVGMVGMFAAVVLGAVMVPAHIQHENLETNTNKSVMALENSIGRVEGLAEANRNSVGSMREQFLGMFEETEGQIASANSMFSLTWSNQQRLNQLLWKKVFNEELPPLEDGMILAPTRRSRR